MWGTHQKKGVARRRLRCPSPANSGTVGPLSWPVLLPALPAPARKLCVCLCVRVCVCLRARRALTCTERLQAVGVYVRGCVPRLLPRFLRVASVGEVRHGWPADKTAGDHHRCHGVRYACVPVDMHACARPPRRRPPRPMMLPSSSSWLLRSSLTMPLLLLLLL